MRHDAAPRRDAPSRPRKPHALGRALLGIAAAAAAARLVHARSRIRGDLPLPPALAGERRDLPNTAVGSLSLYADGPAGTVPILLIHSVNAAGSGYEVKPIYDACRGKRRVYALDLPGFGFSAREDRPYTPRLMTNAILAAVADIRRRDGAVPVDAVALSLSCEFLARAAVEEPACFASLALVSPTGLDARAGAGDPADGTRAMPRLHAALTAGPWRRPLFDLLTTRRSIRYFLEKTWGSRRIDEGMLDYDYLTTHQPGAEFAPYRFIAGYLFSRDAVRLYEALRLPVLLVHGLRGDFVDYRGKGRFEGRPNWRTEVMETGALPHFERPAEFMRRFEAFLSTVGPNGYRDADATDPAMSDRPGL